MHPEQLARQVEFLRSHPETSMVYADYLAIDDRGEPLEDPSFRPQDRRHPRSPEIHLPRDPRLINLEQDNFIGPVSCIAPSWDAPSASMIPTWDSRTTTTGCGSITPSSSPTSGPEEILYQLPRARPQPERPRGRAEDRRAGPPVDGLRAESPGVLSPALDPRPGCGDESPTGRRDPAVRTGRRLRRRLAPRTADPARWPRRSST